MPPLPALFQIVQSEGLPPLPEELSPSLKNFLVCILQKEPELRPCARQLLQHPWMRDVIMQPVKHRSQDNQISEKVQETPLEFNHDRVISFDDSGEEEDDDFGDDEAGLELDGGMISNSKYAISIESVTSRRLGLAIPSTPAVFDRRSTSCRLEHIFGFQ